MPSMLFSMTKWHFGLLQTILSSNRSRRKFVRFSRRIWSHLEPLKNLMWGEIKEPRKRGLKVVKTGVSAVLGNKVSAHKVFKIFLSMVGWGIFTQCHIIQHHLFGGENWRHNLLSKMINSGPTLCVTGQRPVVTITWSLTQTGLTTFCSHEQVKTL